METGLCLGTNMGDRPGLMKAARDSLMALPRAHLIAQSALYETEPVDVKPEYAHLSYLNAVVVMESEYSPTDWLQEVRIIEASLGRERGPDRYAPRTIDLDILYVDRLCVETADLIVPHPRWLQRAFVVYPLAEVRPHLRLPHCPQTVSEVLAGLDCTGVQCFRKGW